MTFARDTSDAVMRRRLGANGYDELQRAQRDVFAKDMADTIADVAAVLAESTGGRWCEDMTEEQRADLAGRLRLLEIEMREIVKW